MSGWYCRCREQFIIQENLFYLRGTQQVVLKAQVASNEVQILRCRSNKRAELPPYSVSTAHVLISYIEILSCDSVWSSKSRQCSDRLATTGECEIPENRTKDKEIFPSSARPLIHSSHQCDTPIPPSLLIPPSVFTLLSLPLSLFFRPSRNRFGSALFSTGRLIFKYSSCPVRLLLSSSWYLIIHRTHSYTHFIPLNINFRHVCDVFWGDISCSRPCCFPENRHVGSGTPFTPHRPSPSHLHSPPTSHQHWSRERWGEGEELQWLLSIWCYWCVDYVGKTKNKTIVTTGCFQERIDLFGGSARAAQRTNKLRILLYFTAGGFVEFLWFFWQKRLPDAARKVTTCSSSPNADAKMSQCRLEVSGVEKQRFFLSPPRRLFLDHVHGESSELLATMRVSGLWWFELLMWCWEAEAAGHRHRPCDGFGPKNKARVRGHSCKLKHISISPVLCFNFCFTLINAMLPVIVVVVV